MFKNATEILTLIASAIVQWFFYRKRLPKDFSPKRILVVKLDHIGDVLLATPVFSNLRKAYPNSELHVLTGSWSRVILENHPDINQVLEYNSPLFCRSGIPTSLRKAFQLYKQLRQQEYDMLIELRGDWRFALFALLRVTSKRLNRSSLQIGNKFGFSKFSGKHETIRNLDVLKQADIPTPIQNTTFEVASEDKKWTSDFLTSQHIQVVNPIAAIHPGSPIPQKRWKTDRFAELADWLVTQKQVQILFVGVKDEIPIINEIQDKMQTDSKNIAGKTNIPQLASILLTCSIFIGNDSGPMHLAAAVGTPTIGLYGPGDPERFGPVGQKCFTIRKKLDCPPCQGKGCKFGAEGCMSKIQVEDVIQSIQNNAYLDTDKRTLRK